MQLFVSSALSCKDVYFTQIGFSVSFSALCLPFIPSLCRKPPFFLFFVMLKRTKKRKEEVYLCFLKIYVLYGKPMV